MKLAQFAAAKFYNRGTKALDRTDSHNAQRGLLASLACAPYTGQSWLSLGNALMQDGDVHAALGCFRRAMTLEPNEARGSVNAAIALLTLGQWDEGWQLYENRFALPEFQIRNGLKGGDACTMWDGANLHGKTLLVFNEQGVGDTLMCLRYGQSLLTEHRAGHVIYRVPASLLRLVRANVLREDVVTDTERLPAHDAIAPFMSLPGRCGKPTGRPYLHIYRADEEVTRRRFPTVGLVWAGNPNHKGDARRSMPAAQLSPILTTRGVSFVSLQIGARANDLPDLQRFDVSDYYDTACVLKTLDLLVTVDTSVAHLAGALGVPTWLMLPFAADFRWGQHSETTPWYSSVRIFRQTTAGDWSSVIERVRSELAALVPTRSAA